MHFIAVSETMAIDALPRLPDLNNYAFFENGKGGMNLG
ncbi:hypothetical protein Z949_381 [Sulfitobacter guttiformis KCTC 32187]|nr:hypothetical protein Z949_381 [Sulfitobacter guttiformis KCTC 32187]